MMLDDQIDWARMAKPQPDGYDSDVMAALLQDRWQWSRAMPGPEALTLVGGTVAVVQDPYRVRSKDFADAFADVTTTELAAIDQYLAAWPAGYVALAKFLDQFWPKRFLGGWGRGSCSGHHAIDETTRVTNVFVTVSDPQGCAEGIYHEVGHFRLETLGMNIDDHDGRLITNPITDGYTSPVRRFAEDGKTPITRPMCAVIHGLYAWLMLSENDLWCAEQISASAASVYLRQNLPKISDGIAEIERYAQPTPRGEPFLSGMLAWARDIVDRGERVLAA